MDFVWLLLTIINDTIYFWKQVTIQQWKHFFAHENVFMGRIWTIIWTAIINMYN
jgi:hypothetical protein